VATGWHARRPGVKTGGMADLDTIAPGGGPLVPTAPAPSLVTLTHVIYGLHALSVLIGLTSAATVVGAFVFSLPSILAVILNYAKRSEARGTFLESHFRWQIRTFWYALLWCIIAGLCFVTLIGIPLAFAIFFGAGIWVMYRVVRGWMALADGRPMYT
jgi:uncharacterized membrane protein